MNPMYLGDGVYVAQDARDGLRLWTSDGIRDTNMIYIDWSVWSMLMMYVKEIEDARGVERGAEAQVQSDTTGEESGSDTSGRDPSRNDPIDYDFP